MTRLSLLSVGASLSDEYDYTHTGVNARIARDFNNRNTTLSFGAALAHDTIDPVGGAPLPLDADAGVGDSANKRAGDEQGRARPPDRRHAGRGPPYARPAQLLAQRLRRLSRPIPTSCCPSSIPSRASPSPGRRQRISTSTSSRAGPTRATSTACYALVKHDFDGDVLDVSYRYMTDDWGIDSHTFDVHYRWDFASGRYLQPHVRFYTQTAADFYETVLFAGEPLPRFASADYRLGEFDALTFGVKYGKADAATANGRRASSTISKRATRSPDALRRRRCASFDLYPDLNALIAQFSYQFGR